MERELLVSKIENGIVIDHIPAEKAFLVLKFLKVDPKSRVVVASNVDSTKYDKKDMIKVEGKYLTSKEIDLISLVAPTATINRIEDWRVKEKHKVKLPDVIEGVFKCPNLSCVTNSEYRSAKSRFKILSAEDINKTALQCLYCNSLLYSGAIIDFLMSNELPILGGLVSMEKIEKTFLDIMIKKGALRIASAPNESFVLKSGRASPYFINVGALTDGESLAKMKWALASYIALLLEGGRLEDFDFVFGPAYKGISLASLVCEGLSELFGMEKRYMYDRKEEKVYGDMTADKVIVGAGHFNPGQKILMVDDVVSTGRTKVDALEKLKLLGDHEVVGLVLAVDRQERMGDAVKVEDKGAVDYLKDEFGLKVYSVLNIQSIFDLIKSNLTEEMKRRWVEYYERYGAIKLRIS